MPTYNPWPLGKIPEEFRRPEIQQLRNKGYIFEDPREANKIFEDKLMWFTGAPYVILTDNCTDALFLALYYTNYAATPHIAKTSITTLEIPARTYLSVPQSISQAGYGFEFEDYNWSGAYNIKPLNIWDAAVRFTKDMYIPGTFMTLSFQIKKRLPIGKGGAILCDDPIAANILRKLSFEGRDLNIPYDKDQLEFEGWNMYMTPEDAARGILLFDMLTKNGTELDFPDTGNQDNYTDLRLQKIYQNRRFSKTLIF